MEMLSKRGQRLEFIIPNFAPKEIKIWNDGSIYLINHILIHT